MTSNTQDRLSWAEPWDTLKVCAWSRCSPLSSSVSVSITQHGIQFKVQVLFYFYLLFETVSLCVPGWLLTVLTTLLPQPPECGDYCMGPHTQLKLQLLMADLETRKLNATKPQRDRRGHGGWINSEQVSSSHHTTLWSTGVLQLPRPLSCRV